MIGLMFKLYRFKKGVTLWRLLFLVALSNCSIDFVVAQPQEIDAEVLFSAGESGYRCFRIPATITSPTGEILAFAEGRKTSCADFGDVDIVMKRSVDEGLTWSRLFVVVDNGTDQAGNSAPVWDVFDSRYPTGRLFLFYNTGNASEWEVREGKGSRDGWYITSADQGRSWSDPVNITSQIHPTTETSNGVKDFRTLAFTPGHAIQLTSERFKGRIVVAANHSHGPPMLDFEDYRSFAIFSDDHGKTWMMSDDVNQPASNEAMAVELEDGQVMMNIRMQDGKVRRRLVCLSDDGGKTWQTPYIDYTLKNPVCQASILMLESGELAFVGPNDEIDRKNLSLWKMKDGEWLNPWLIYRGPSAYSDITEVAPGELLILFEADDYSRILTKRHLIEP